LYQKGNTSKNGILFFGTSQYAAEEAMDILKEEKIVMDAIRLKSFPFTKEVENFINTHDKVFVIEQNRDAQMRSLLMIELNANPNKLIAVLNYDGMPITADNILKQFKSSGSTKIVASFKPSVKSSAKPILKKATKKVAKQSAPKKAAKKPATKKKVVKKVVAKKKPAPKKKVEAKKKVVKKVAAKKPVRKSGRKVAPKRKVAAPKKIVKKVVAKKKVIAKKSNNKKASKKRK